MCRVLFEAASHFLLNIVFDSPIRKETLPDYVGSFFSNRAIKYSNVRKQLPRSSAGCLLSPSLGFAKPKWARILKIHSFLVNLLRFSPILYGFAKPRSWRRWTLNLLPYFLFLLKSAKQKSAACYVASLLRKQHSFVF